MGLVLGLWPDLGLAQLAPTGGHYAARASDTGTSPGSVNASGGYSVSIPLDLPGSRGGLPVPLSIGNGARGVGAVGLGWDVPLSYIRRDMSFAHRKPRVGTGAPTGREQVTLSLQGQTLELFPQQVSAGPPQVLHWGARNGASDLLLKEVDSTWVMYDGDGRTWTFTQPNLLFGAGLWLLTSITGPDNTAVQLTYDVSGVATPGAGVGYTLDLRQVLYNKHPQSNCFKNELTLNYGAPVSSPLSLSLLGTNVVLTRVRTLSTLDVSSRATCASSPQRLRTYTFAYQPDADTRQPRLVSVSMLGRQGTAEQSVALPVASFTYGVATTSGALTYARSASIPLPSGVDSTKLSSTGRDGTFLPPLTSEVGSATWQSLTDVTGDGLPDFVYAKGGKLWVALNKPNASGATTLGTVNAQLADATFASGPFESRSATEVRFPGNPAANGKDRVWRQAFDINSDGRIDFIDAGESPYKWVIYLNTPGTGPTGIQWQRRSYSISALYNHLVGLGHSLSNGYLPLSSRFSGRDHKRRLTWKWNAGITQWELYPQGYPNGATPALGTVSDAQPEKTYTEWEVTDINGDGFLEFVFNSSPVTVYFNPPGANGTVPNQVIWGDFSVDMRPTALGANEVQAFFNTYGVMISDGVTGFSSPVTLKSNAACGVGLWVTTSDSQLVKCGLADVNGDGLLDRVEDSTVSLGTGSGFSVATLTLPGSLSVQENAQERICTWPNPDPPLSTPYGSGQTQGLRDLTGDGIPDYVASGIVNSTVQWTVAVGTGAGFAPAVNISVVGSAFSLSNQTERCDGLTSNTTSGLYDLNGDGKPEVVRLNGTNLDIYQLSGGTRPGKPEAGRIIRVGNNHGALTTVAWRSAKEDGTTKHQVPFPEVVVSSVVTVGGLGLGGTLAETRYAYGGAELVYDSALHTFTMPAYQRSVTLSTVTVLGKSEGYATLTDTYPQPAFDNTSPAVRFARSLLTGKVRDVTTVTSSSLDPWTLLATDLPTYAGRLKSTHVEWGTKYFPEPVPAGTPNEGLDCFELAHPLDFQASYLVVNGGYDACRAHGFAYERVTDTWRGSAAPPSTANVVTRSEATDVDDFGRFLNVKHANDVYRTDDDLCVETKYATPTGTGAVPRVLHAPRSRRYWTCDKTPYVTYASESWLYDGLASGSVSLGHLTSHLRDRRDLTTGALLNTVTEYTTDYDAAGNPATVSRVREDGATRTVKLIHDEFGLAPMEERVDATGLPTLTTTLQRDPLSLEALLTTDPNQTRYGVDRDGYGRRVRATVQPLDGALGVMSTTSYLGFAGADPLGRRVVSKTFTDPVPPGTEGSALGHTSTTFLDELGRTRRTESPLGSDYGTEVMISGERTYDDLGRVVFEADPHPASQNAATAYGTSSFFNLDGTPSCTVRGNGPQAYTATPNLGTELLPTCYSRTFANHLETVSLRDAAALSATAPQVNVVRSSTLTAVGRVLSRSTTRSGTPLEHATFTHDRLGQMTGMTRYLDPVGLTGPVTSSWVQDSFGQRLSWQEPDSAPRTMRYSDWGEPLEVKWTESITAPTGERSQVSQYDAQSRVTHTEERTRGVTEQDTVHDFLYDFGGSPTSLVTPTNVLGRLARTKSPLGEVFYSYDPFGQVNARVYTDAKDTYYVEKADRHADGTLDTFTLQLPDNGYEKEMAWYAYDTAQRLMYVKFEDPGTSRELYVAKSIDAFGRVRNAIHGGVVEFVGDYADTGRRMTRGMTLSSSYGSRSVGIASYDAVGRELVRTETVNGASVGVKTNNYYDALGRLATSKRAQGGTSLGDWQYTYDALGNVLTQSDLLGSADAAMSYGTVDRDRLCRIGYGNGGLGGTACNVTHDSSGNVLSQPTRTGLRNLSYLPSGDVRSISAPEGTATFRSGPLGTLRELDLRVGGKDARHEWKFGDFLELKEQVIGGKSTQVLSRHIPGPDGIVATRRGLKKNDWVFPFGELRGARYSADTNGQIIQDVDYQPFGEAKSSGSVAPGALLYSSAQWNGGEALESLGVSQLGARIYDPVIGRFLGRDPLLVVRTAATTHPYAFSMNDPVNRADPTGMDSGCMGQECRGPSGGGFPDQPGGGGGPSTINNPGLYFPSAGASGGGADPQAAVRPIASTASFSQGPRTAQGVSLMIMVHTATGIAMDNSFNFDALAASGATVEETINRVVNSQQGAEAIATQENGWFDRWSSFSQGIGDSLLFWCPGCTENMRNSWGITSGGDSWHYAWGSVTGIIGMLITPSPTMVIRPPKVDVAADLRQFVRINEFNPSLCRTNCSSVVTAVDSTLAGTPRIAVAGPKTALTVLEGQFGGSFESIAGRQAIEKTVTAWGPGSRGIVAGRLAANEQTGHVFNVINKDGRVYFIDAQIPWKPNVVDWKSYDGFMLMRTN
ncbi:toxin glutamine deamidase domain-containing protein [Corallococcus sp. bb12-1]|uniref:RHS repeat-associated core domain-containing protein n=1 Tax=Corallococcus sp. bb12-1 TaxID=2996784 RepID=UPI00226FCE1D|nr:RHS repeat-associated core domain-containing protein [Corallococcus sp. bb12-1]MCY1047622.1 toxin glutamine deamidase domain-containing protein [Corallococcus sp. bb12-1]